MLRRFHKQSLNENNLKGIMIGRDRFSQAFDTISFNCGNGVDKRSRLVISVKYSMVNKQY